jgi:hypothetical protein
MTDTERAAYELGAANMRLACIEICLQQCEAIEKAAPDPVRGAARIYRWGFAVQEMFNIPTAPKEVA